MHRVPLPSGALYPLQTLLGAGVVYGVATMAHGSGFLAVFVAGILLGDVRAPYKAEIERFHSSLASLAEIIAFAVLGLTVSVTDIVHSDVWWVGLILAVVLALVLRPLLVGPLLLPVDLRPGERLFVMWSGLKGAVPILLGTYVLTSGVHDAERLYGIVVVVVTFSVIVQAGLVPTVAERAGVPMRVVEPEPWSLGMRFRDRPSGLRRFQVGPGCAGGRHRDRRPRPRGGRLDQHGQPRRHVAARARPHGAAGRRRGPGHRRPGRRRRHRRGPARVFAPDVG